MGLGTKIKEALHGDHQTSAGSPSHNTPSTGTHNTPGAFPSDDVPQRHTDGKTYTAPRGIAVDDTKKAGTHPGTTSGLASSGTQRNRLSKGTEEYDPLHERDSKHGPGHRTRDHALPVDQATGQDQSSKGTYWGDLSNDGQQDAVRDLPDRTRLGESSSAATDRHHGAPGHHHDHRLTDQAVGGGVYNATPAQGSHGTSNRDPTEDSHFGEDLTGNSGRHHGGSGSRGQRLSGHTAGDGVYNSVSGSGSPEHYGTRTSQQTGTVHDPFSSGTKGVPLSSGNTSGNSYGHQDNGFRGNGVPITQNDRTGHSHGLKGATAAAVGGYGGHEHGHQSPGNTTNNYSGNKASDGVPRSSMLDPEPAFNGSNSPANGQSAVNGYGHSQGTPDYHGSRVANVDYDRNNRGTGTGPVNSTAGHTGQLPGGLSNVNTSIGHGSGPNSSASPTQSASSGSGRNHLGPGHEAAKVMHSCQHCGQDNDISHYFNKDVVYRLGQ